MKRSIALITILLLAFVVFQGTADAKLVLGKVAGSDVMTKTLSVTKVNAATGAEEKVEISVPETATLTGVTTLDQIKTGDEVWVEANEDAATGKMTATSVKVTPAMAPAVAAAPTAVVTTTSAPIAPAIPATEPAPAQ